jgi:hypothetical protein
MADFYLQERFLVLISVRGCVDRRAIVWLEGFGQLKNPMISLGIKPVSFQLGLLNVDILKCRYIT